MNEIILNGACMTSRSDAHDELARALNLPEYYGRNLDALWDLISTMQAEVCLVNSAAMLEALGGYGEMLLNTLQEAHEAGRGFIFRIQ